MNDPARIRDLINKGREFHFEGDVGRSASRSAPQQNARTNAKRATAQTAGRTHDHK